MRSHQRDALEIVVVRDARDRVQVEVVIGEQRVVADEQLRGNLPLGVAALRPIDLVDLAEGIGLQKHSDAARCPPRRLAVVLAVDRAGHQLRHRAERIRSDAALQHISAEPLETFRDCEPPVGSRSIHEVAEVLEVEHADNHLVVPRVLVEHLVGCGERDGRGPTQDVKQASLVQVRKRFIFGHALRLHHAQYIAR